MAEKNKPLFYQSFRHKRYRVFETHKKTLAAKNWGQCDAPCTKDKEIEVILGHSQPFLSVQIHEALHACLFDLDEGTVDEISDDIAKFLWKLGWRNVSPKESKI